MENFKEGKWLLHNGKLKQITKVIDGLLASLNNSPAIIMKNDSLESWEPKEKEYFWYRGDLVKFSELQTNAGLLLNSIRGCSYYANADYINYCEPFIGKLPTFLKDNT